MGRAKFASFQVHASANFRGHFLAQARFRFLCFGFLFLRTFAAATSVLRGDGPPPAILLLPLLVAVFGFLVMKCLLFDLVDSVWDAGTEPLSETMARKTELLCEIF